MIIHATLKFSLIFKQIKYNSLTEEFDLKMILKKLPLKMLLILPLATCIVACSSGRKIVDLKVKYVSAKSTPTQTVDKAAQAQVAEAATAIGHSLQQLSAMQMATHPETKIQQPINANAAGMGHLASVSWTGPAEPLLEQIAKATHYSLRVIGAQPATPVLVSVSMRNQPVASILRNITYQIVSKASVSIYPKSKIIELRYRGN